VRSEAAKAIRYCNDPKVLAKLIVANESWESNFDLTGNYDWELSVNDIAARQDAWKRAQDIVLGDRGIFLTKSADDSLAVGKGYKPLVVSSNVFEATVKHGLRTPDKILTADEREGRRIDEVTDDNVVKAVVSVWNRLVDVGATRGEEFPGVKSYQEDLQGEKRTLGLWKDGVVYINTCLVSGQEISKELFAVCLEELAHHITKATDNSRDFQEFFIQLATTLFVR